MPSVNNEFIAWLKNTYAKDGIGEIKFKKRKVMVREQNILM